VTTPLQAAAQSTAAAPATRPVRGPRVPVPRVLYLPAAVGVLFLLLPLAALIGRADWAELPSDITSGPALRALRLSVETGVEATLLCLVLGVPLGLILARRDNALVKVLRALVTLPLVLPPMVGGVALLYLMSPVGGWLGTPISDWFGYEVSFTTTAVVIAQAFVALPFLVLSFEGSLRTAGTGYDTVAATLGAGRWVVFWRVTLPLVRPGLTSATVLCFARALGEFGATALFAGNSDGVTRTMPLAIYTAFNGAGVDQNTAVALSLLLIAVAAVILILVQPWRVRASA
jgi:molybdate transport system permease protein